MTLNASDLPANHCSSILSDFSSWLSNGLPANLAYQPGALSRLTRIDAFDNPLHPNLLADSRPLRGGAQLSDDLNGINPLGALGFLDAAQSDVAQSDGDAYRLPDDLIFEDDDQTAWDCVEHHNDISICTRAVNGDPINILKGEFTVNGDVDHAIEALLRPDKIHDWIDGMDTIKLVNADKNNSVFQMDIKTKGVKVGPVVISSRLLALDCKLEKTADGSSAVLHMNRLQPPSDLNPALVYVLAYNGRIEISAGKKEGTVHFKYQSHMNPGGKIPHWVTNFVAKTSFLKSLRGARNHINTALVKDSLNPDDV